MISFNSPVSQVRAVDETSLSEEPLLSRSCSAILLTSPKRGNLSNEDEKCRYLFTKKLLIGQSSKAAPAFLSLNVKHQQELAVDFLLHLPKLFFKLDSKLQLDYRRLSGATANLSKDHQEMLEKLIAEQNPQMEENWEKAKRDITKNPELTIKNLKAYGLSEDRQIKLIQEHFKGNWEIFPFDAFSPESSVLRDFLVKAGVDSKDLKGFIDHMNKNLDNNIRFSVLAGVAQKRPHEFLHLMQKILFRGMKDTSSLVKLAMSEFVAASWEEAAAFINKMQTFYMSEEDETYYIEKMLQNSAKVLQTTAILKICPNLDKAVFQAFSRCSDFQEKKSKMKLASQLYHYFPSLIYANLEYFQDKWKLDLEFFIKGISWSYQGPLPLGHLTRMNENEAKNVLFRIAGAYVELEGRLDFPLVVSRRLGKDLISLFPKFVWNNQEYFFLENDPTLLQACANAHELRQDEQSRAAFGVKNKKEECSIL